VLRGPPLGAVQSREMCPVPVNKTALHSELVVHTQLAAGIALHGLSLAVTGKVVGTTALVAGGRARTASEASPSEASETTTGRGNSTSHTSTRVGAVAGQMAGVTAAVASSAGTSSAQAESGAVSLDVSEALAVVALLGCDIVSAVSHIHNRIAPSPPFLL
jgi:hypothetical protein